MAFDFFPDSQISCLQLRCSRILQSKFLRFFSLLTIKPSQNHLYCSVHFTSLFLLCSWFPLFHYAKQRPLYCFSQTFCNSTLSTIFSYCLICRLLISSLTAHLSPCHMMSLLLLPFFSLPSLIQKILGFSLSDSTRPLEKRMSLSKLS